MSSDKHCCVPGCEERGGMRRVLQGFPNPETDRERFNTWLYAIGGDILGLENERIYKYRCVCRSHFEDKYLCRNNRISNIAVPTLNMPSLYQKILISVNSKPLQQILELPSTSSDPTTIMECLPHTSMNVGKDIIQKDNIGWDVTGEHNYSKEQDEEDITEPSPVTTTTECGDSIEHNYFKEQDDKIFTKSGMSDGANVPEVLSEQKANKYVQASPASPSSTSPRLNQVVDDADPVFTEEDDDADESDTPVESNMCRVCLALDVKMYDLRDNELKIMFQNITGITFNENNHSALGSICWECAARLKSAATFRSKALLSDLLLQDLITSGQQIRKNYIAALKENVLFQGLISSKTLTAIDVFHIVDIEEQNNANQLLQTGDDGDQTSLSISNDTEKSIIQEITDQNYEMYVEEDDIITINTEIEDDTTSPNNEERNPEGHIFKSR